MPRSGAHHPVPLNALPLNAARGAWVDGVGACESKLRPVSALSAELQCRRTREPSRVSGSVFLEKKNPKNPNRGWMVRRTPWSCSGGKHFLKLTASALPGPAALGQVWQALSHRLAGWLLPGQGWGSQLAGSWEPTQAIGASAATCPMESVMCDTAAWESS